MGFARRCPRRVLQLHHGCGDLIESRTATVVQIVADLSKSLDIVQTVGLLFKVKELVLVKQGVQPLDGTCCIYELGIPCPCPCSNSKCIFPRLISCDLSRLNKSGIDPILVVLTWKGSRLYQLTISKNFVISRFLTYIVETVFHSSLSIYLSQPIWVFSLSQLYAIH